MNSRRALRPLIAAILFTAAAASLLPAQGSDSGRDPNLVGHWRNTRIVFESSRDEHLVLRGDGSAETWTVTATGRSAPVKGRWETQARTLSITWDDGAKWSRPFTFYENQLVFPNIQKQRKFWERLQQ
jgi:hypothetical protein